MITLQDLIDLAQKNNINPRDFTLLFAQKCGNGDIQYDYFVEPKIVSDVNAVDADDEYQTIKKGISLEIMDWDLFSNYEPELNMS